MLAALLILVERFKFQHLFLSTICQSAARATSDEAFRRAGPEYSGNLPRASRKRREKATRRKTNDILRRLLGGRRVREAETNSSPGKAKRFRRLDRFFAPRGIVAFGGDRTSVGMCMRNGEFFAEGSVFASIAL